MSVHFAGRRVECINYVKDNKVILGIDSTAVLFDFKLSQKLATIPNPTRKIPLRLISLKNGSSSNNLPTCSIAAPSKIFITQDYAGILLIDVNTNQFLPMYRLIKGEYCIFVEKRDDELLVIHTTQVQRTKTKVKKMVKEKQIVKRGFFKKDKEVEVEKEIEEDGKENIVRDYLQIKVNLN